MLGIVAGTGVVQRLTDLPIQRWLPPVAFSLTLMLLLSLGVSRIWRPTNGSPLWGKRTRGGRILRLWLGLMLGTVLGTSSAMWQAQRRLDDSLAWEHHDTVSRLIVRIADLAQGDRGRSRFLVDVDEPRPAGIPARLSVSWHAPHGTSLPELRPGQRWRMAVVLRLPHGAHNPDGYDAEGRLFAMGIRATATVRGTPVLLDDDPWSSPGIVVERVRYWVRDAMRDALGDRRYAPVMIALAIGDQAAVAREDWQIFNRSGITHLVSISGMHVTLIAAVGGVTAAFLWRRARWRRWRLAEYLPAQVVGAAVALWVALFYCLLAGWGVPARRTFFMLAVVALAAMVRLPLSASRILLLAGALVSLLDPWATLAPGFWLSFGAVAILLRLGASIAAGGRGEPQGWRARAKAVLTEFSIVQSAITLGLIPLLAYLMHQVSVASPLVNVFAIPTVSFLVTPLALACAVLGVIPGFSWLAQAAGVSGHAIFEAMMTPVSGLSTSSWAVLDVAAAPWSWLMLALCGVAWAVQPSGLPWRSAGWLLMVPMLCWRPDRPLPGHWTLTALDVGQGSAIVIETATQVWLFDTGPMTREGIDAGERVVVPFLRARGYGHLNGLIVSHADLDHAGGLGSVLSTVSVGEAYSSFDLPAAMRKRALGTTSMWANGVGMPQTMTRCQKGQAWTVDGVQFRFLHPDGETRSDVAGNARSCVLMIQGKTHTALLPGDIGTAQERRLAPGLPPVDVVLAPHHGSKTSSSDALVRAVQARHVIAQAGYMNRFGHPTPSVQSRWQDAGARFWRTDLHGALVAVSAPQGLAMTAQALASRRYWHRHPPDRPITPTGLR